MTIQEVDILLKKANFIFAKSMPKIPHEYTHRESWDNDKSFCDLVLFIRENGIKEKWFGKEYVYLYINGYKYWTMGNPVSYTDKTKTFILNRVRVND